MSGCDVSRLSLTVIPLSMASPAVAASWAWGCAPTPTTTTSAGSVSPSLVITPVTWPAVRVNSRRRWGAAGRRGLGAVPRPSGRVRRPVCSAMALAVGHDGHSCRCLAVLVRWRRPSSDPASAPMMATWRPPPARAARSWSASWTSRRCTTRPDQGWAAAGPEDPVASSRACGSRGVGRGVERQFVAGGVEVHRRVPRCRSTVLSSYQLGSWTKMLSRSAAPVR